MEYEAEANEADVLYIMDCCYLEYLLMPPRIDFFALQVAF